LGELELEPVEMLDDQPVPRDGKIGSLYLANFLDVDDQDKWETEIGWPIFRSDPQAPNLAQTPGAGSR
jgi:hypothetical protein